ncbi:MAG: 23S rRNA (uracil(1939)-C(5))-methyltransferase RlmD [Oscillospiraceae bacterium]|nr:23S rRNA (uracil(1939)-C(5))-methyltransferase RlmD [Oscillospiraceae bacterium]
MMKELAKNDIYEARITGFTSQGAGVCRIGGRAVFVPGALPGEQWRVRIVKVARSAVWGRGEELLLPSPSRTEPLCPAFGKCGGCAAMHMTYDQELQFKLERVNNALQRIGGLAIQADSILAAPRQEGYRNKAIYNFAPGPVCGFYRARSHEVIPAQRCYLQPTCFDRAAAALLQWMRDTDIPAYDERSGDGAVRHLFLRRTAKDFTACIVSARPLPESAGTALRAACPELTGVMLCENRASGNTVLDGPIRLLWGRDTVEETLCGATFELSPLTFFQVNTRQAETLYTLAGEYAEPAGKTVLDLYCGAGTIGLSIARDAARLIGSDIVPTAIVNAQKNAAKNGVKNAEYFCGDAKDIAQKLAADGLRPDVIITDPPRKGMDEQVLSAIVSMAPERLVYVSCDPATLSRDLRRLNDMGYTATACRAVDMFPRTYHCETICSLSRIK